MLVYDVLSDHVESGTEKYKCQPVGASCEGRMAKAGKMAAFSNTACVFDHHFLQTAHPHIALVTRHVLQQTWFKSGNALARYERLSCQFGPGLRVGAAQITPRVNV